MIKNKNVIDIKPKIKRVIGRVGIMPLTTQIYDDASVAYDDANVAYDNLEPQYEGHIMPSGKVTDL